MLGGLALGVGGATLYALGLEQISMAFEGFGQEYVNSALLVGIAVLLATHNFLAVFQLRNPSVMLAYRTLMLTFVVMVAMAITREGAEIYLYAYSYGVLAGNITAVFSGGVIGLGIGLSVGTFFYYGLRSLARRPRLIVCCGVSLVLGASMMGQASVYLSQADVLPYQEPLWDSSGLFEESSLMGELLRATLGYEAQPTLNQVSLYLSSVIVSILAMLAAWRLHRLPEPARGGE